MDEARNLDCADFDVAEDEFAEDDLFTPDDGDASNLVLGEGVLSRSFLERDNFENELGLVADDPFAEDFSAIAQLDIVNVIADGDRAGRPIIVIYAYRLPSNKTFDHQQFLRFLQFTLDKVVELDYTIVYFHYGLRSNNKPPLKWLLQAYNMLDRRYKKNLKALFLVHPTRFIRCVWSLFKPLLSIKFERKVHYVNLLHQLESSLRVEQLNLPQPIRDHDTALSTVKVPRPSTLPNNPPAIPPRPTQQFNVPLSFILAHNPDCDIPPIVSELISFLRENSLQVEGLFRRSAEVTVIRRLQERVDRGERVDFVNEPLYENNATTASIHASVLLKTFLRSLGEPLITNAAYPQLALLSEVPKTEKLHAVCDFVQLLPRENLLLLRTVCAFLREVAEQNHINKMTANNLSVVFGPNLTWPTDRQVPISQLNNLNNFCYRLIVDFNVVFEGV